MLYTVPREVWKEHPCLAEIQKIRLSLKDSLMFQCIDGIDIASTIFALDGFTIVITPMTDAKWY